MRWCTVKVVQHGPYSLGRLMPCGLIESAASNAWLVQHRPASHKYVFQIMISTKVCSRRSTDGWKHFLCAFLLSHDLW
jgi:hypothetical protein